MANTIFVPRRTELGRLTRFLAVGASGTVLDIALLTFFKEAFGMATLLANTLSYSAGIINNYLWNRLWTYPESRAKKPFVQLAQFAAVSITGLLLNNLLVVLLEAPLTTLFTSASAGYLMAKLVATLVVVCWNFAANRHWTFNDVQ